MKQLDERFGCVGPRQTESVAEARRVPAHPFAESPRASHVALPECRLGNDGHEAMNSPDDVARGVGDVEPAFADANRLLVLLHCEVIRRSAGVRGDDGVHITTRRTVGRLPTGAGELPCFVDAPLALLHVAPPEIQQPEPDEQPRNERLLT